MPAQREIDTARRVLGKRERLVAGVITTSYQARVLAQPGFHAVHMLAYQLTVPLPACQGDSVENVRYL